MISNSTVINKPDLTVYALNTSLSTLNSSNIASGVFTVSRGGTGTNYLYANQILIGNATTTLLQSANLTWYNASNTLSATNLVGAGSGITALNASNIAFSTLSIARGAIGTTTLPSEQILIFKVIGAAQL